MVESSIEMEQWLGLMEVKSFSTDRIHLKMVEEARIRQISSWSDLTPWGKSAEDSVDAHHMLWRRMKEASVVCG